MAELSATAVPAFTLPAGTPSSIPFGPFHLPDDRFGAPFTGALRNGNDPSEVLVTLAAARRAHVHIILNMFVGRRYITRPDGSFDLERWKARIDRFRNVGLEPYVADGTLAGHYLLDEPHDPSNWNGLPVPLSDIEAAAAYSKSIWPDLTTFVRTHPSFLAKAPFRWVALDAAWAQYASRRGNPREYAQRNARIAQRLGLGLVVGLNVLDGGEGRSGRRGPGTGKW
ncbi:MAG: hypothetical protein H0W67_08165, partial [Gemmatimonadales bacterium]|nr:hypothetical protein [Gemmatimonadales bacterium]